jgi:phage FluMu protein Com
MILSYSSFCAEKRKLLTKVGLSADVACTRQKKVNFIRNNDIKKMFGGRKTSISLHKKHLLIKIILVKHLLIKAFTFVVT